MKTAKNGKCECKSKLMLIKFTQDNYVVSHTITN